LVGAETYAFHGGPEEDADVAEDGYGAREGAAFGLCGVASQHGAHRQGESDAAGSDRIRSDCSG